MFFYAKKRMRWSFWFVYRKYMRCCCGKHSVAGTTISKIAKSLEIYIDYGAREKAKCYADTVDTLEKKEYTRIAHKIACIIFCIFTNMMYILFAV